MIGRRNDVSIRVAVALAGQTSKRVGVAPFLRSLVVALKTSVCSATLLTGCSLGRHTELDAYQYDVFQPPCYARYATILGPMKWRGSIDWIEGDLTLDGQVDGDDLIAFAWAATGPGTPYRLTDMRIDLADLNRDGRVDMIDFGILQTLCGRQVATIRIESVWP